MSALAQAVKGTTSNQLSKAKNYLGSFFGAAKTPVNYNTGGVESDSLRKSQKFFKDLAEVLAGFIKKLNSIVTHLEKKSQGHGQQASLFTSIKNDTQKLELLGLEASQIEKLAKVNEQSETRVNAFKVCIKNYYLFYFEDLLGDVQAAAYRIQERLDKETQIKANIMNITDLATLQDQWDTHVRIMNEMTKEMSLYQAQSQQSLINLLSSLERSKAKHYNEVSSV